MKDYADAGIDLIVGKLSRELTKGEEQQLKEWLEEDAEHQALFRELEGIFLRGGNLKTDFEPDVEKALQKVKKRKRFGPIPWRYLLKYTAVLLICVGTGCYCLYNFYGKQEVAAVEMIEAGGTRAILYLASGEKINLENIVGGTCLNRTEEGDIWIDSNQTLKYNQTGKRITAERRNMLEVPVGGEYQLTLSDGTRVWLNAASRLTYPEVFTGRQRIVELVGEAFFKVTPDSTAPFIVRTRAMSVKVLGTAFNVKAYQEDEVLYTTLVKGKVEVFSDICQDILILHPGEQALANSSGLEKRQVNLQPYISWIDGKFVFVNAPLCEICKQISRWYDVEIRFTDERIREICFTGAMMKFRPLDDLLRMIESTSQVKFNRQGKILVLSQ